MNAGLVLGVSVSVGVHLWLVSFSSSFQQPQLAIEENEMSVEVHLVQRPPVILKTIEPLQDNVIEQVMKEDIPVLQEEPVMMEEEIRPELVMPDLSGVQNHVEPLDHLNNPPEYPVAAIRKGYEGVVHLKIHVSARGHVKEFILIESSGYKILDQAAMTAVEKWRFNPAMRNGMAIDAWLELPAIRFDLQD